MPKETYRYPGSRPFQDTALDRKLFRGRAEEAHDLLHLVLAERLVVVFGKSGLGKSSLINAGLLEPLRRRDYLPMVLRVNDPEKGPLSTLYKDIEEGLQREGIEVLTKPGGRLESKYGLICRGGSRPPGELSELCFEKRVPLWLFFAETELWRGDVLCEPILVFDQFEELFSLQEPEKRQDLVADLANLMRKRIISSDGEEDAECKAPPLKILLSLREDWLGSLEELVLKIPGILTHRFRLGAMKKEQAREAIEQPAEIDAADVGSRSFGYTPEAVDAILEFLSRHRQNGEMVVTDRVAPSQLQLICQHLEELVHTPGHAPVITLEDLGGGKEKVPAVLNGVLEEYYDEQTTKVACGSRLRAVRRLCETGLVVNGRRASCDGAVLRQQFRVTAEDLRKLTDCHLLRAAPRLDSVYYEIAHDTLVGPILASRRKRRQRRHRAWSTALAAALLVVGPLGAWNLHARNELEERGRILAELPDQMPSGDPLGTLLKTLDISHRAGCLAASDDEACGPIAERLAKAVDAAREIGPPENVADPAAALGPGSGVAAASTELTHGGLRQIRADSNQLLVFDNDETVQEIQVPFAELNAVAVDASGRRIAIAATDGTLRLWDRDDALSPLTGPWTGDSEEILAVAFDPRRDRFLTSGRADGLQMWDLKGKALEHEALSDEEIPKIPINAIAWSRDGERIAIGGKDGVVRVWNGVWRRFEGHALGVRGVTFDPAGLRVASVGDDGALRIWDLENQDRHRHYFDDNEENQLKAVAWSGDGRSIATGGTSKKVHLWQLDGTAREIGRHEGAVLSLAFRPDGTLASGGRDGAVRIWDPADGTEIDEVPDFKRFVNSVVSTAGGSLVAGSYGGTVAIVPGDQEPEQHQVSQHDLTAVALSPGGTYLASGSSDSTLRLRRWDSGESLFKRIVTPIRETEGEVKALAFDAGGEKLASFTADGDFRIRTSEGDPLLSFPAGGAGVEALGFAGDGSTLVSRSADGTYRFWDISEGTGRDARAIACKRLATLDESGRDPSTVEVLDRVLRRVCGAHQAHVS